MIFDNKTLTPICKVCKKTKTYNDFYDNNYSTCKKCVSDKQKPKSIKWQRENRDKIYVYKERRKEKQNAYYKKWYAENGRKRDPLKTTAHKLVSLALKSGKIIKPLKCVSCSRTEKIEAHHNDYFKPLEVEWLCNRCHRIKHTGVDK